MRHVYIFIIIAGLAIAAPARAEGTKDTLTLETAIQTAMAHNAAIKEAENQDKSAREGVKSSRADFLPKASATYSYTKLEDEPYQQFGGTKLTVGDTDNVHWDVTLTQPLFTGFKLTSVYDMAKTDAQISSIRRDQVMQTVVQDVKTAYYQALLASRMEKVAKDKVKTLEAQEKDAEGFYDQGIIPQNDLLKARITRAAALQELEQARANARIARTRLAMVMGASRESDPMPRDVAAHLSDIDTLETLTAQALKNRPELRMMARALTRYDAAVTLSKSSWYPEVALVGSYEQNGDDPVASDNDYTNDHNTSVSVQAKWTFFEWGKKRSDTAKIRYDKSAYQEKIRAMEDQVRLEVKQAYLNMGVSEKNIKTAKEALDQAHENFRITQMQYRQHVTTATELLDAQSYLSGAESDYYKALYGFMIDSARLDCAVGKMGEWNND